MQLLVVAYHIFCEINVAHQELIPTAIVMQVMHATHRVLKEHLFIKAV